MFSSRYTRDEIISQGVEETASSTLIAHDLPGGNVAPNAYSIKWLQRGLDMFHRKYPFANTITTVPITILTGTEGVVLTSDLITHLPDNFIIEVRNGIEIAVNNARRRLIRQSYQYYLDNKLNYSSNPAMRPFYYCLTGNSIKTCPLTIENVAGILHYYALPALLQPTDLCNFPDEESLVKFITLRGLEWANHPKVPPGTAQSYLQKQLASFRSAGLLFEPEYEDGIPLENNQVIQDSTILGRNSWMGSTV